MVSLLRRDKPAADAPGLEGWLWEAACRIRGAIDAPKYKDFILPLIFLKRISDVFEDELRGLAAEYGSRQVAERLVDADLLGAAYEYLLRTFAEGQGRSAGEFFTPPEVAALLARLLAAAPGDEIIDPACGSGGLLVHCAADVLERHGRLEGGRRLLPADIAPPRLYGQEWTHATAALEDERRDSRHGGDDRPGRQLRPPGFPGGRRPADAL